MAIRRAKQAAQVIQLLSTIAPVGEQFIACVHAETGPSPWLNELHQLAQVLPPAAADQQIT